MMNRRSLFGAIAALPFAAVPAVSSPKDVDETGSIRVRDDIHEDRVQLCRLLYNYMYDNRGKSGRPNSLAFLIDYGVNHRLTLVHIDESEVMWGAIDNMEFTGLSQYYVRPAFRGEPPSDPLLLPVFKFKEAL